MFKRLLPVRRLFKIAVRKYQHIPDHTHDSNAYKNWFYFYSALDLKQSATQQEIEASFRKLKATREPTDPKAIDYEVMKEQFFDI
jgi:DnaJ-class molecular chaperone